MRIIQHLIIPHFVDAGKRKNACSPLKTKKVPPLQAAEGDGLCSNVIQNVLHDLAQEEVLAVHGNIRPLFVQGDALVVQVL